MPLTLRCLGSGAAVSAGPGRATGSARGDVNGGPIKEVRGARITVCSEVGSKAVQRAAKEPHNAKQIPQNEVGHADR